MGMPDGEDGGHCGTDGAEWGCQTAKMEGIAEGERLTSFLATTAAQIPDVQSRLELWKVLRKRDALEAVSGANSHFYYTPADANLTIEARQ